MRSLGELSSEAARANDVIFVRASGHILQVSSLDLCYASRSFVYSNEGILGSTDKRLLFQDENTMIVCEYLRVSEYK